MNLVPHTRTAPTTLHRMGPEIDRLLERFFEDPSADPWLGAMPSLDLEETEDEVLVTIELPGVEPGDVDVSVQKDVLTVSGEKKAERETEKRGFRHSERTYGRFRRSLRLPADVDPEHVEATQRNGVLTVTMKKSGATKPRRVTVRGS